jgi:hypothetical protein
MGQRRATALANTPSSAVSPAAMADRFLLDTWAFISFLQAEPGAEASRAAIADMKRLAVAWQHSDDALCASAAEAKAAHKVSFADAFVMAAALRLDAVLVHKDPELAAVPAPSKQELLPLKTAISAAR